MHPIHEASLPSSYKLHFWAKNCFVAGYCVIALHPATHFDSGKISLQSRVWALVTFFDGGNTYLASRNKAALVINYLFSLTICVSYIQTWEVLEVCRGGNNLDNVRGKLHGLRRVHYGSETVHGAWRVDLIQIPVLINPKASPGKRRRALEEGMPRFQPFYHGFFGLLLPHLKINFTAFKGRNKERVIKSWDNECLSSRYWQYKRMV